MKEKDEGLFSTKNYFRFELLLFILAALFMIFVATSTSFGRDAPVWSVAPSLFLSYLIILVPLVIISFSFFRGPETLKWILNLRKEKPEIGSWWHKGPWWFTSLTNKSKKEKNKPEINYEEFLEKIKATKDWELPLHKMEKKDLEALQKNSGLSDLDFNEFRKLCRKLKRTEERDKTEKQLQ